MAARLPYRNEKGCWAPSAGGLAAGRLTAAAFVVGFSPPLIEDTVKETFNLFRTDEDLRVEE